MTSTNWRDALPEISQAADTDINTIFDQSQLIQLDEKTTVFHQGDHCKHYLIVLDGHIRVFTRAENGREIVLYRLHQGDSCVLTTSCLFGHTHYPAEGITESKVSALAIPTALFDKSIKQSDAFRKLVFSSFSSHVHLLITLVEEVAFGRLDIRLARHLLALQNEQQIKATHQELATELGSAREVISRQLKEMELKGLISLHRGSIEIISPSGLQNLAR